MFHNREAYDSSSPGNLWDRFIRGDDSCFRKLFLDYYNRMYGYGLKLSGREELVKDCIQELFKTIWERREELTHIKSPNVYLFVSLRRRILKEVEKEKKVGGDWSEVDENKFFMFGIEEIIITDETNKQKKRLLHTALNQLSDRQKEVIYLHFYNGMSYGEIEQILSINRQSVRNHVYRAMETLRALLGQDLIKLVISIAYCMLNMSVFLF